MIVPFKAGFKPFSKLKMDVKVHSILLPTGDFRLLDLSTVALHKLGVKRTQLIDTTKAQYPATRCWAQAPYTQFPDAQGLRWTSRQDDQAHAVMLFGTRVSPSDLGWNGSSEDLLLDGQAHRSVIVFHQRCALGASLRRSLARSPRALRQVQERAQAVQSLVGKRVWNKVFRDLVADRKNLYLMLDSTIVRAHQQEATGPQKWGADKALGRS